MPKILYIFFFNAFPHSARSGSKILGLEALLYKVHLLFELISIFDLAAQTIIPAKSVPKFTQSLCKNRQAKS